MSAMSRLAVGRRMTKECRVGGHRPTGIRAGFEHSLDLLSVSSGTGGLGAWGSHFLHGKGTPSSRSAQWKKDDKAIHTLRIVLPESGCVLPPKR